MHWSVEFYVFFLGLFSLVLSDSLFYDCGNGDKIYSFSIAGCDNAPCLLQRGHSYHVYLTPFSIDPEVKDMVIDASVCLYGAQFRQFAIFNNPCVIGCPLREKLNQPQLDITVQIDPQLISRPGLLMLNATFFYQDRPQEGLCASTDVDIY